MGGHDIMKAYVIAHEQQIERDLMIQRRNQVREAKATDPGRVTKVTWFEGLKATARFLTDSAQAAIDQRRMTEVNG